MYSDVRLGRWRGRDPFLFRQKEFIASVVMNSHLKRPMASSPAASLPRMASFCSGAMRRFRRSVWNSRLLFKRLQNLFQRLARVATNSDHQKTAGAVLFGHVTFDAQPADSSPPR